VQQSATIRETARIALSRKFSTGQDGRLPNIGVADACAGEVPVMVALRLLVPESWTSNPVRLKRAGVPDEHRAARSKSEIALAEIDRVMSFGMRFGCVLADAGYGLARRFDKGSRHAGLAGPFVSLVTSKCIRSG